MRNWIIIWAVFGLTILVGCSTPQEDIPVSASQTPKFTETTAPTQTMAPAATITDTPTPTPFPTATPIDYPILSSPQGAPDLAQMDVDQWMEASPDGEWQAAGMVAWPQEGAEYHVMLTVSQSGGPVKWALVDAWYEAGLGAGFPAPVQWSADGQYFYFSNQMTPDGCSLFSPKRLDLYRLTLATGEVQAVLPGSFYGVFLSPDGRSVAAFRQVTRAFVVDDLDTGQKTMVNLDPGVDYASGAVVWSPDGDRLALTLAIHPCGGGYDGQGLFAVSSSIVMVDTQTGEVRTLIEEDDRKFETVAWDEPERITLKDKEGALWLLNVNTGELIQQ